MRTVVIASDEQVTRAGLHSLIEQNGLAVVAEGDGDDALRYLRGHTPDVLVFDPGKLASVKMEGFQSASPDTEIVVLTERTDNWEVVKEVLVGGCSLVLKDEDPEAFLAALNDDGLYINPHVAVSIAQHDREAEGLTAREREILTLIAAGYTNAEMADRLFLSIRTVESHRAHIMEKINADSRRELVDYAVAHHLFPLEAP